MMTSQSQENLNSSNFFPSLVLALTFLDVHIINSIVVNSRCTEF